MSKKHDSGVNSNKTIPIGNRLFFPPTGDDILTNFKIFPLLAWCFALRFRLGELAFGIYHLLSFFRLLVIYYFLHIFNYGILTDSAKSGCLNINID